MFGFDVIFYIYVSLVTQLDRITGYLARWMHEVTDSVLVGRVFEFQPRVFNRFAFE